MGIPLFSGILSQRSADRRAKNYRDLIRKEAKIGGSLFGPLAKNAHREFFCLDRHTWVWHEEWVDTSGRHNAVTTRYDVRPHGIMKAQDGLPYHYISEQEAKHFFQAVKMYTDRVQAELYPGL